jgi:hypothetical protein
VQIRWRVELGQAEKAFLSRESLPSSTSRRMADAVNVFEIPAILKSESGWTHSSASRLDKPYPRASIKRP